MIKNFLKPSLLKIILAVFIIVLIGYYFLNLQNLVNLKPNSNFYPKPTLIPNTNQEKIHLIIRAEEGIVVEVDGKNALTYKVEEVRGHCHWDVFETVLDKGSHTLTVVNNIKQTTNQKEFILGSELWFNIVPYIDPINIFQSSEPLLCK